MCAVQTAGGHHTARGRHRGGPAGSPLRLLPPGHPAAADHRHVHPSLGDTAAPVGLYRHRLPLLCKPGESVTHSLGRGEGEVDGERELGRTKELERESQRERERDRGR